MKMESSRDRGTGFAEMFENGFGLRLGYDRRERGNVGLLHGLQAAEMFQQTAGGGFAHPWDFSQLGGSVSYLAALAMEGYGEAMGLVANHLD